jgi:hypothetical protein
VRAEDTEVLGEFVAPPLAEPRLLHAGPAEAVVYLATNKPPRRGSPPPSFGA